MSARTPGAFAVALAVAWLAAAPAGRGAPLQDLVDATPAGGVLRPAPGVYGGPVVVERPIRIDGAGAVTVDGGGTGTVILLRTDGAELRGLHITRSGSNHDRLDAGVQIRGRGNVVEDNRIDDVLFGVELQKSDGNRVAGNRIRSKPVDMGLRGDGIRLWYSRENEIADNDIRDVRDVVVWYSGGNRIVGNRVRDSRYALHFMYSERNLVEDNRYEGDMVGVFLMYSDGVELRRNHIERSQGATGMGVGFKESSNVVLEGNDILYCSKGVYLDISPYEPDTQNHFRSNVFAYNGVAIVFHSDWHGNVFEGNRFKGNFSPVTVRGGGSANGNTWRGNTWDDYVGFDRDRDGVGDVPYEHFSYADRFWVDLPAAAFFRGSPLFEAIDLLDRLAPFSEPTLVVRDPRPVLDAGEGG